MTVILIVIILAVAGFVAYKTGAPKLNKIKSAASQAFDKIEPAIEEVKEVVKEVEKAAPKNDLVKKAAKAVKAADETVKKVKTKKTK